MKPSRPDLAAMALCALIVVGICALALVRVPIPDVLPYLGIGALSAGAGVALGGAPLPRGTAEGATTTAPPVPAQAAAPAIESIVTDAATAVATHAP